MSSNKNKGLSEIELKNRLELYERFTSDKKDALELQRIKKEHSSEKTKRTNDRAQRDANYAQGNQVGLPQGSYEQLKYYDSMEDQKLRDQTIEESKPIYRKYGVSKEFEEANKLDQLKLKYRFDQTKSKLDRGKDK